jgi:hypothetical protein
MNCFINCLFMKSEHNSRPIIILSPQPFKNKYCQKPVTHTCNPGYSRGRDPEDGDSKPVWASSLGDSISKKPFTKHDWWSGSTDGVPAEQA